MLPTDTRVIAMLRKFSLTVVAAWLSVVPACSTKRCSGQAITCANQAAHCDSVPGCTPVPACVFSFTAVDTVCGKQGNQQSCEATTASACMWTGQRCTSVCPSITDPQTCHDFSFVTPPYPDKNFPCTWSTCSGVPVKQYCDEYSTADCPAQLHCAVKEDDPVGT